jgi:hypothetical protein
MIAVYRKNSETPYEAIEGVCINNIFITINIKNITAHRGKTK